MPHEWLRRPEAVAGKPGAALPSYAAGDPPLAELHLWPYRSLPRRGMAAFLGATCGLAAVPLVAALGTPVVWGVLPFFALVVGGLWCALSRSYRDGEVMEVLRLWSDRVELTRRDPRRPDRHWTANPFWIRVVDHGAAGPVPHYLTLAGAEREVEIGAFLPEDERVSLAADLRAAFAAAR
jgi:uncharacterized membrane protein